MTLSSKAPPETTVMIMADPDRHSAADPVSLLGQIAAAAKMRHPDLLTEHSSTDTHFGRTDEQERALSAGLFRIADQTTGGRVGQWN